MRILFAILICAVSAQAQNYVPRPLPDMTTHSGQFLTNNGAIASWAAVAMPTVASTTNMLKGDGSGNVSSAGFTMPGSYSVGDLLIATASGTLSILPDVATGSVLVSGGVGVAPSYTAVLRLADGGTVTAYGFAGDSGMGMSRTSAGILGFYIAGNRVVDFRPNGALYLPFDAGKIFMGAGADVALTRPSTTAFAVRNGGDTGYLDLFLRSLRDNAVTFANAVTSPSEGTLQAFTDSSTATWGATITGGGANHVLGYYDGTNWTVMGK